MRPLLTLVLGIIWLMLASWCFAGVDQPSLVTDPSLITLITTTGDDVFATTNLTTLLDPMGNGTQHYGPYPSSSTDSGTCGTDWANDTFDRHFTVRRNPDGTFLVVEQFKDGSFTTPALDSPPMNPSPGGCQTSPVTQGLVNAGVTGSLDGYFIIPLGTGEMQMSTDPHCNATTMTNTGCDTMTFIDTHFTPGCYPATCGVTTFFFHYSAGDQMLVEHEWKNASTDRGGNHGDIRSTNVP
jgi:hypothetical protein